jgi:hypothetical protein
VAPPSLLYSPHQRLDVEAWVYTLIDTMTGWWNTQLIQDIFTPEEAPRICSVTPSPLQALDTIIWKCTTTGVFTVKSAYHMEKHK